MNPTVTFICLLVAFVLFVAAVIFRGASWGDRCSLIAAGLAAWVLPALWAAAKAL